MHQNHHDFIKFLIGVIVFFHGFWCFAEISTQLEPDYAEAVLAYNAKDYQKALKLLEALEKKAPNLSEVLELQALSYKALKDESKVEELYQKLIQVKTREGKGGKDLAPYHFELGLLRQKEKKLEEARKHFEFSLENEFNAGVSHLYLGMFNFQSGSWAQSEKHFKGVTSSSAMELRPIAYFYLGQVYGKMEYAGGATASFVSALNTAKSILDDPESSEDAKKIAKQIFDATAKVITPFDRGQWFGNAGFVTGYDSNVLAIPTSVSESDATGKASVVNTVMLGFGYASSPLRWIQFVPSYRGSFPYNLNRDSSSAEYPTHTLSLYMTANSLLRFSYGLKGEGSLVLQNTSTSTTGRFQYEQYSRIFSFGPYLKYEWKPKLVSGLEFFLQPRSYIKDNSGSQKRSGAPISMRIYLKSDQGYRWWNPGIALKHESEKNAGADFQYEADLIELSDMMHLSERLDLTSSLNFSLTKYPNRSNGVRNDKLVILDLAMAYKINPKWTGMASGQFANNSSNDSANFSYKRFSMTAGASYTF